MHFLDLREPFSAWSHGAWLMMSVPSTMLLWNRSRDDRGKQLSLLVFGLSLATCYAGSTLFHSVNAASDRLALFSQIDHIGIYVLIAGTYTPLAWNLLSGRWRWTTLTLAWCAALAGSTLHCTCETVPNELATVLYLLMGWGAVFCYTEISRTLSKRAFAPIIWGGVLYSTGAAINVLEWPKLWPGTFGAHDLFHLFVMAGSLAHFWFMLAVVVPFGRRSTGFMPPRPHLADLRARQANLRRMAFLMSRLSPPSGL